MSRKPVNRADLCEAVHKTVSLSRSASAALVTLVLEEITNCLEHGETVKLSSFGTFVARKSGAQERGTDRKKPEDRQASANNPRKVAVFKPSQILKKRLATTDG